MAEKSELAEKLGPLTKVVEKHWGERIKERDEVRHSKKAVKVYGGDRDE